MHQVSPDALAVGVIPIAIAIEQVMAIILMEDLIAFFIIKQGNRFVL